MKSTWQDLTGSPGTAVATDSGRAGGLSLPDELFQEIVRRVTEIVTATPPDPQPAFDKLLPVAEPVAESLLIPEPLTIVETGLSLELLQGLLLKWTALSGRSTVSNLSQKMRLPGSVIRELLPLLAESQLIQWSMSDADEQVTLLPAGEQRVGAYFAHSRYVGPAPVALQHYLRICVLQEPRELVSQLADLQSFVEPLLVSDHVLSTMGISLIAGHSLLIQGDSGNGKTELARRVGQMVQTLGGEIAIPFAVAAEQEIVTIYDPQRHRRSSASLPMLMSDRQSLDATPELSSPLHSRRPESKGKSERPDQRWLTVQRPVVHCDARSSSQLLKLWREAASHVYHAPLAVRANGGALILDHLGSGPATLDLIESWIPVLDSADVAVTFSSGKSVRLPVRPLTVFVTHHDPNDVLSQALLRRIKTRLSVSGPAPGQFRQILRNLCSREEIPYDDWSVSRFLDEHYNRQSLPKFSDPHNLLQAIKAICRFHQESPRLTAELLALAWNQCRSGL